MRRSNENRFTRTLRKPQGTHPISRESGLSLIELMIAMVVGLILIAGVLSIFLSSRKSYGVNGAVADIQQNARFSLEYIRSATRMAGYMGCGVSGGANFHNQLKPAGGPWPMAYNFGQAINGFEFSGTAPTDSYTLASENPSPTTSGWTPTLDSTLPAMIPGSDVLVVSLSQPTTTPLYVTGTPTGAQFWVSGGGLSAGQLLSISNCVTTVLVQATNVNGAGGAHVVSNTGTGNPGNYVHGLPSSMVNATVTTSTVIAFYIGQGADGSPALYEVTTDQTGSGGVGGTGFGPPTELVPGVEDMQVLYGVDTNGTLTPSEYVTADQVTTDNNWPNVVSVRVALLLRSPMGAVTLPPSATSYNLLGTVITAPRDTRLRRVFTSTIMLRNR